MLKIKGHLKKKKKGQQNKKWKTWYPWWCKKNQTNNDLDDEKKQLRKHKKKGEKVIFDNFNDRKKETNGRGFVTPLFYEGPYIAYPLFSNLVQPRSPTSTSIALFVALFLWLNGRFCHIWCVILCNHIMDLHTSSLVTIVPERLYCVFYAARCQG